MYTHTCTRALGVLFQFQNNFTVTQANRRYVESLSRRLAEDITMAVEFRHRSWFDDVHVASTTSWLAALRHDGAALVATDNLEHEIANTYTDTHIQTHTHRCGLGRLGRSGA